MAKEVTLILADDTYAAAAAWAGGADQVSAYLQRLVETMLANLGRRSNLAGGCAPPACPPSRRTLTQMTRSICWRKTSAGAGQEADARPVCLLVVQQVCAITGDTVHDRAPRRQGHVDTARQGFS